MAKIGDTVFIICNSRSPVHWNFNGNKPKLSNVNFFDYNYTLIIVNASKLNEGYYYCQGETNTLALEGLQRKYQQFHARSLLLIRSKFLLYEMFKNLQLEKDLLLTLYYSF